MCFSERSAVWGEATSPQPFLASLTQTSSMYYRASVHQDTLWRVPDRGPVLQVPSNRLVDSPDSEKHPLVALKEV